MTKAVTRPLSVLQRTMDMIGRIGKLLFLTAFDSQPIDSSEFVIRRMRQITYTVKRQCWLG